MTMARVTLADHFSLQHFQGGEQRGRAMALFIYTQHHGVLRGIEIQADDIGHLLQKPRISGQLEALGAVGLEVVATPDVANGGFADPLRLGHEATTPLRHALGFGLQSGIDDLLNFLCPIARFAAASWGDLPETLRAALGKAGAPQGDGRTTHREALRNGVVGLAFGCGQHNLATQGDLARGAESSVPLLQLLSLSLFQGQGGQGTWHGKTIAQVLYIVKLFVVHIGYLFSRHYTRIFPLKPEIHTLSSVTAVPQPTPSRPIPLNPVI